MGGSLSLRTTAEARWLRIWPARSLCSCLQVVAGAVDPLSCRDEDGVGFLDLAAVFFGLRVLRPTAFRRGRRLDAAAAVRFSANRYCPRPVCSTAPLFFRPMSTWLTAGAVSLAAPAISRARIGVALSTFSTRF